MMIDPSPQIKGTLNPRYKTSLCKNYNSDHGCQYGDKCQFAHGTEELRVAPNVRSVPGMIKPMQKIQKNILNYKIVKCKNFEKEGKCKYGEHCSFAHGDAELRVKQAPFAQGMNGYDMLGQMGMIDMGMGMMPYTMMQQNPMMQQQNPMMMMGTDPMYMMAQPGATSNNEGENLGDNLQNFANLPIQNMTTNSIPNLNNANDQPIIQPLTLNNPPVENEQK